MVQVKAEGKHLPISPRKLRLVAQTVRGKKLLEALVILDHLPQKGARILKKVANSAMANAVNNFQLNKDNLFIQQIVVGDGARYKRLDYSHGARFNGGMIQKRLSHLKMVLEEKEEKTPKLQNAKTQNKLKTKAKISRSKTRDKGNVSKKTQERRNLRKKK